MIVYEVFTIDHDDTITYGTYSSMSVASDVKIKLMEADGFDESNTHVYPVKILDEPIELQKVYSRYYSSLSHDRFLYEVELSVDRPQQHIKDADVYHHERKDGRFSVSAYGTDKQKVKELFEKTMREL